MHYKIKSMLTISTILGFMVVVALIMNNLNGGITGAAVKGECECSSDSDCNDDNKCTDDLCLYKDNCEAALCVHMKLDDCN